MAPVGARATARIPPSGLLRYNLIKYIPTHVYVPSTLSPPISGAGQPLQGGGAAPRGDACSLNGTHDFINL